MKKFIALCAFLIFFPFLALASGTSGTGSGTSLINNTTTGSMQAYLNGSPTGSAFTYSPSGSYACFEQNPDPTNPGYRLMIGTNFNFPLSIDYVTVWQ